MNLRFLAFSTLALLALPRASMAVAAEPDLVFNTTAPTNDLKGDLAAQVLFAQSQVIPARPRADDRQPRLVSFRKTLLMVRPEQTGKAEPLTVAVVSGSGTTLGTLTLKAPNFLPPTAYFIDGVPPGGLDFSVKGRPPLRLNDPAGIQKLSEPDGKAIRELLGRNPTVEVETGDGRWTRDIHLPPGKGLEGKTVVVSAGASYGSTIHYDGRTVGVSRGQRVVFKCVGEGWFREGELDNNRIRYASDAWSCVLPGEWIQPGVSFRFRRGSASGELTGVAVGAVTQLLLHTIDIGMLTTPRAAFSFAKDPEAHREYFQTLPATRLVVSQYAPLHLTEVMLPTGELLKELDPGKGGWHEGTMRQRIGKELVSHGIDNANYGLHSTAGVGESSHPYVVAQLTAHNNRGVYANGVQVHGGSGGGGIVTLDDSLGNEFSHEVGHNYGLGHYVDGFKGSVHRSADQVNSTWGWDADRNRFIPNFAAVRTDKPTELEGQAQPPFDGRSFGLDAMAGGAPFSAFNRFTLYTPNTAAIIQKFLEGKASFDPQSPTGFSRWNERLGRLEPFAHRLESESFSASRKPAATGVPVVTLVGYYDPSLKLRSYVYPPLHGAYGLAYPDDSSRVSASDCQLAVETRAGVLRFRLEGKRIDKTCMNKFHVNVPSASQPRSVSLVIGGKVVDKRPITPTTEKLAVTVNGLWPAAAK